jgi:hypothetical protein
MSILPRPSILIQVKQVTSLKVDGKAAVLQGIGMLNGTPARVTVSVVDNFKPSSTVLTDPAVARDTFKIEAYPIVMTLVAVKPYVASGPVFRGDLIVGQFQTN